MGAAAAFVVLAGLAAPAILVAQEKPQFGGTWRLDRAKSVVSDTAGIAGLAPKGAPDTLHITQPVNGTLVIESQINESHMRLYKPGAKTTTAAGAGTVDMTARWEGRTLVSEGTRSAPAGEPVPVREVISLNADGTLEIEVTATEAGTRSSSTLIYAKIQDVGPCEKWPTPCKRPQS
jgi:hypothetical protein